MKKERKQMTSEIVKVFENEEFGRIRTVEDNGKILFCGSDVAKALGYVRPNDAISSHCRATVKCSTLISGKMQDINYISEGDLYRLICNSKLPTSEKFELWVFDEVLPTMRKTGGYVNNTDLMVNTYFSNLSDDQKFLVKSLFENVEATQKANSILSAKNELLVADTLTWADRPLLNSLVRRYTGFACNGEFALAWTEFKKEILYKYSININSRITNYLNKTGKKTKPKTLEMLSDDELVDALKTIVSMCENKKVDISDLLTKKKSENVA